MRSKYKLPFTPCNFHHYESFNYTSRYQQQLVGLLSSHKQLWRVQGLSTKVANQYTTFYTLTKKNMRLPSILEQTNLIIDGKGRYVSYCFVDSYKIGYTVGDFLGTTRKDPNHRGKKRGQKKRYGRKIASGLLMRRFLHLK